MTCGMTVAPRMPAASSTLSESANFGVTRPLSAAPPSGCACRIWNTKAATMMPTSTAMTASRWRTPRSSAARIANVDDAREHAGGQERHAEEQVEAERGADELGEVAGHRDRLGLEPEEDAHGRPRSARR